jgi:hypothetical protein
MNHPVESISLGRRVGNEDENRKPGIVLNLSRIYLEDVHRIEIKWEYSDDKR